MLTFAKKQIRKRVLMSRKTGVLFVGLNGGVASTVIAGLLLAQKGLGLTRGMLTEEPLFDRLNLISPLQLVFGGWDTRAGNLYESAIANRVIKKERLEPIKKRLSSIVALKAVITRHDETSSSCGKNIKPDNTLQGHLESLIKDIRRFKKDNGLDTVVVVYTSSAQKYLSLTKIHRDRAEFQKALRRNNQSAITSGMLYALAAIETRSPFVDFTANRTLEVATLTDLAREKNVPVAGKDGCTGQTLLKTVIAHLLRTKDLRVIGWYSTNILGNNDGRVLTLPGHQMCKIEDKKSVLKPILGYNDFPHLVSINYYPPRNDDKEAWDNIDFLGWMDEPMSIKINFLAKDSILAAPLVVDLIRLLEHAARNKNGGIQKQLSLFFKYPIGVGERAFFKLNRLFEEYYTRAL